MGADLDITQAVAQGSRLAQAGARIGAAGSAVFRRTVFAIEADAKTLAPVDTGALMGSVSTTLVGDGRSGAMSAEIGPTVEYGVFQELGTSVQAAQPYMAPAFDRQIPGFESALGKLATAGL